MQDDRDITEGPQILAMVDALTAGRSIDWDTAADTTPPEQQSLVRELTLIARVREAHAEGQVRPIGSGGDPTNAAWGPLVILEKIGEGAFGDVYRAREPRLDRQVALKFFRPHRLSPSQLTSDVIEEGRLLARVHHPNVVTVYGAEHLDGRVGIWMEFVAGTTLEEIVAKKGPLSAVEAMAIGRDLCRALAALHTAGVLHRDIKARNVMREDGGRVVLMDLGISCEIDGQVPIRQYGTPLYVAPEVLLANESSRQGDIYSLGVLLYFLVSGRYPVTGSTLADIHKAHETGQVESLATVCPDLPAAFHRIVEKALAESRDVRIATAAEFEQLLDEALRATTVQAVAHTEDQQAYNYFLQGRHFLNRRYRGGLPRALEFFQQAAARDPDFALAHAGIAESLNYLSFYQYVRPREGFPQARTAAEKALELEPRLGEAQAALGWISMYFDWDFVASEQYFQRAIQLSPQYALARQSYGLLLSSEGKYDEALAEVRAGRELDPGSLAVAIDGLILYHACRFEEAIQVFRLALETDPESMIHTLHLGVALWHAGDVEEAESCLRRAFTQSEGESSFAVGLLATLLALSGREDEALEMTTHLEALAEMRYTSYFHRLMPWFALQRYDKWGPLLDKAIEERDPFLVWVRKIRVWESWRADPRFVEPLQEVGLVN